MSCIKCGGTMIGDGYLTVMRCEFANEEAYEYAAPDEGPFYCDFEEITDNGKLAEFGLMQLVASQSGVTAP